MSVLNPDGSIIDPYGQFIALSRYARWNDEIGRRETWSESVDRYMDFMTDHLFDKYDYAVDPALAIEISEAIKNLDGVPSMRSLMTAGPALALENIAGYNCAYMPIDDIAAFSEALYILMNGTGVGYSVEHKYVSKLPEIPEIFLAADITIQVGDSKLGWAQAYKQLLEHLWLRGWQPGYDTSQVRPAGSRLKTFGGRASGPEPLKELFDYTIDLFWEAQGRRLRPIEVHDLMCKIASVVVVGGVRRSAMICLSDLFDMEMATAKSGEWWKIAPQRRLANISAVYHEDVTMEEFDREWSILQTSGSGERGIFNRYAAQRQAAKNGYRDPDIEYGTNPCGEIILRPFQFCNLSEVIIREDDTYNSLDRKVELATILGTWQSTLTDFNFLRPIWKKNTEEERLLGVSLTGIYGNKKTSSLATPASFFIGLNEAARATNAREAEVLGINPSAAICTVKPSGTVSQLAGVSSGIHPWHARQYIRTVRADHKDPLAQLMQDSGVPCEPDLTDPDNTRVFSFPVKAPDLAVTRSQLGAIQHLELWLAYRRYYCDHNPSVTVSVRPEEWYGVSQWVWEHLDEVTGITFLPYDEHTYKQAPYQEVSYSEWRAMALSFPNVRWADLSFYELEDSTAGSQTLACAADGTGCDSADLVTA